MTLKRIVKNRKSSLSNKLKGVSKLCIDFDNTLFDAETKLSEKFPEFEPKNQSSYKLDKLYLKALSKASFYENVKDSDFNKDVVRLVEQASKKGIEVVCYSLCPNKETAEIKESLVMNLFPFSNVSFMPFFIGDKHLTKEFLWFRQCTTNAIDSDSSVLFVDDAPQRLIVLDELKKHYDGTYEVSPLKVLPIKHPYNLDYVGSVYLLPNYMEG